MSCFLKKYLDIGYRSNPHKTLSRKMLSKRINEGLLQEDEAERISFISKGLSPCCLKKQINNIRIITI